MREKETLVVVEVQGVRGYIDDEGTAWLNAEDVARGLGFTQVKNGVEYVMWWRVENYLREFGFSADVRKGFIPENMFYRLAMKASNATAQKFQALVADEILPALRKQGYYSVKNNDRPDSNREQFDNEQLDSKFKRLYLEIERRRKELEKEIIEVSFQRIKLFHEYNELESRRLELKRLELEQKIREFEYQRKLAAFVEKIARLEELYLI